VPYLAAAQIELQTAITACIMLYCTWLPSYLASGLHGQACLMIYDNKLPVGFSFV